MLFHGISRSRRKSWQGKVGGSESRVPSLPPQGGLLRCHRSCKGHFIISRGNCHLREGQLNWQPKMHGHHGIYYSYLCVLGRDWRNILTRVCRRRLGDHTMQFLPHQQLGLLKGEDTALTTYFLLPWSFHFCLGEKKSHNLKKDLTNHLLCNPFTVPGLVKNCCNTKGTQINDASFNYCFLFS